MDYSDIVKWVTLGFTLVFVLMIVIAVFVGMKRGIFKSIVRTATIILAIPVAILLLNVLKKTNLIDKFSSLIDTSKLGVDGEELSKNAEILAKAMLYPIVFSIIFLVVSKLFYFVYLIIKSIFSKKIDGEATSKALSRTVGALVGVLGALVSFFAVFCPINGYIGCLADAKGYVEDTEDNKEIIEVCDAAIELRSNFVFSFCDDLSDGVFKSLTKINYKSLAGKKTFKSDLRSEVFGTLEILPQIKDLTSMLESEQIDYDLLKSSVETISSYDGKNNVYTAKIIMCYVTRRIGEEAPSYFDGYDAKYLNAVSPLFEEMKTCDEDNASEKLICAVNVFSALDYMQRYFDLLNAKTATGDGMAVENIVKYIETDGWEAYTQKMIKNCVEDNTEENVEAFSEIAISIFDNLYKIKDEETFLSECVKADKTFIATFNCIKHKNELTVLQAEEMVDSVIGSQVLSDALKEVEDKNVTLDNLQESDLQKIKEILLNEKTTENERVISAIASIFGVDLT